MSKVRKAAVKPSTDTIQVQWKEPTRGEVTGYRVTCSPKEATDDSDKVQEIKIKKSKETRAKFTNLTPGDVYLVKIFTVAEKLETKEPVILTAKTSEWLHSCRDGSRILHQE